LRRAGSGPRAIAFPGERLGKPSLEVKIHALWYFAHERGQYIYRQGFPLFGRLIKVDTRNDPPPPRLKIVTFSNGSPGDNDFFPI
jgi:hypothetical protein